MSLFRMLRVFCKLAAILDVDSRVRVSGVPADLLLVRSSDGFPIIAVSQSGWVGIWNNVRAYRIVEDTKRYASPQHRVVA